MRALQAFAPPSRRSEFADAVDRARAWLIRADAESTEERGFKRALLTCYETQERMLSQFPIEVERFRPAPKYDFTQPPHAGRLWYENFAWGTGPDEWRRRAAHAMERLGQEGLL